MTLPAHIASATATTRAVRAIVQAVIQAFQSRERAQDVLGPRRYYRLTGLRHVSMKSRA